MWLWQTGIAGELVWIVSRRSWSCNVAQLKFETQHDIHGALCGDVLALCTLLRVAMIHNNTIIIQCIYIHCIIIVVLCIEAFLELQHGIHWDPLRIWSTSLATEGASFCESRETTCWLAKHHVAVPQRRPNCGGPGRKIWICAKAIWDTCGYPGYGLSKSTMCLQYQCHEWHPPLPAHICSWNHKEFAL